MAMAVTKIDWAAVERHIRNRIRNEWDISLALSYYGINRFVLFQIKRDGVMLQVEIDYFDSRMRALMSSAFYSGDTKYERIAAYLVQRLLEAEIVT